MYIKDGIEYRRLSVDELFELDRSGVRPIDMDDDGQLFRVVLPDTFEPAVAGCYKGDHFYYTVWDAQEAKYRS